MNKTKPISFEKKKVFPIVHELQKDPSFTVSNMMENKNKSFFTQKTLAKSSLTSTT